MKVLLLAAIGGLISVLAFPPYGPGLLIVVGLTILMVALRLAESRRDGLLVGAIYGLVFFGGVMWWLVELEVIALVLVPVQAAFIAAYGWWLTRYNRRSPWVWLALAIGGWAVMELVRYRFPVGGLEWGAAGYALSDNIVTRLPASVVGVSGLTLVVVSVAAAIALGLSLRDRWPVIAGGISVLILIMGTLTWLTARTASDGSGGPMTAIVQGSTPCPFEHCPPDERLRTFEQHLSLTQTVPAGTVNLVVWSEGSTGSFNADPVRNPEIGDAIGAEARRIDARFLVGSDRPVSDTEWINANVYFDNQGVIVGEYRKRHPVPFGEYIPLRPLFEWIPALDRVPRDMIPGDGPVVIDELGSIISFEGGFSRYALDTRRAGADVIVVATNEASYGPDAATSDQFLGMTRMRAVELGVPVVHAAVTGKSAVFDPLGRTSAATGLGTQEILQEQVVTSHGTPFAVIGDSLMIVLAVGGLAMWWRARSLVGSDNGNFEEE